VFRLYFFSFFLTIAISAHAAAPPVPAGGVIERQIEKEYEAEPLTPDKKVPQIQIDIPQEQLHLPYGHKVFISQVDIHGNISIPNKEIRRKLRPHINRDLSMEDIYKLCQIVEAIYAKKGFFLARVYPPPQKIQKGILRLEVVEGKLGNIKVIGNKHYSEKFILKYFATLKKKALNYDDFLKALILLNENSDLVAGAVFEKGQAVGTADVILRVEDKYPLHMYINGNDYGRWLTTNFRAGARVDTQLLTAGDKFSLTEVVGFPVSSLYFTDVVYRVPLNAKGTFLEAAYLTSRFHVREMEYLHLTGRSTIATVKVNHAAHRGKLLSSDVFASFDYKQIKNFTSGHVTSFDKIRLLTLGTFLDYYSPKKGRSYTVLKLGMGLPGFLGGLNNPSSLSSRPGAKGNFFKINIDEDYMKRIVGDSFFVFHGSGQWSPNMLTVPEQFYIGGADTIRGFPLASAMGDSGYYCNFEMRFPPFIFGENKFLKTKKMWKDILQFSVFLDQGGVFFKGGAHTYECGTGFGFRINGPGSLALTAEVGFPLNHLDLSRQAFFYFKLTAQPF
jgi:hemolysin activation/secretion protein